MASTAKTKKAVNSIEKIEKEVVKPVNSADCTEYASIAFDRNGNLYGISKQGELFKYNWTSRGWEKV